MQESAFKQSVGKKFGLWYNPDVYFNQVPNFTFPQAFSKLSYILNRDYMIKLEYAGMIEDKIVVEGNNQMGSEIFKVHLIQTAYHGTCVNIHTTIFQVN